MLNPHDKEKVHQALLEIGDLLKEGRPLNKNFLNEDLRIICSLAYSLYQSNDYAQAKSIFQKASITQAL